MGGINVTRWLAGGVVAGIVMWLIEGVASFLYMEDMRTAMEGLGLGTEMTAGTWITSVLMSLLTGLVLVFLHAAARPRFGPGPKTAVIVAVALFLGGMLLSLMGYGMMGMFPTRLLLIWGCIGFVELILVSLPGAWVYREWHCARRWRSRGFGFSSSRLGSAARFTEGLAVDRPSALR